MTASYGTFGSSSGGFDLAYGRAELGNFISVSGLDTGRFLDAPEYQVFHDHGNEQNLFDRVDFKLSDTDSINLNLGFSRSWFQTPNSYDAQNATAWNGLVVNNGGLGPNGLLVGTADQRSKILTFNVAPAWTHIVNANAVFTLGAFVRHDQYNYYPSDDPFADFTPDLQSASVGQNRRLTNAGARTNLAWVNKIHNIKMGATYEHTFHHRKGHFRSGRSDSERALPESRRQRRYESLADQSGSVHGRFAAECWPGFGARHLFRFSPVTI